MKPYRIGVLVVGVLLISGLATPLVTGLKGKTSEDFANALSYSLPGMEDVRVENRVFRVDTYKDGSPAYRLSMDVYYPPDLRAFERRPAVIFVMGYSDFSPFVQEVIGKPLKDSAQYTSWGRLMAAAGLVAVTYQTTDAGDLGRVVDYVRRHSSDFRIDKERIGLFAVSANGPTLLSYAMQEDRDFLTFGVFGYSVMSSPDGFLHDLIALFAAELGFYWSELEPFDKLNEDLPLLIARAGLDFEFINLAIDHFAEIAEDEGVSLTLIDYPEGVHAFDLYQHTPESADVLAQMVDFMLAMSDK